MYNCNIVGLYQLWGKEGDDPKESKDVVIKIEALDDGVVSMEYDLTNGSRVQLQFNIRIFIDAIMEIYTDGLDAK